VIDPRLKLVVILGPTASGKTELALRLAEKHDGEIVCADSRSVYRHLDIGTAKPTVEEQTRVRHHLLDVIDPDERLSAGEFKQLAEESINDIWRRGKVPFLVGGSGLYIDAVIYDYDFPKAANLAVRAEFEQLDDDQLRESLRTLYPVIYKNTDVRNRRRLVRALELAGKTGDRRRSVRDNTLVLMPGLDKEIIKRRIVLRIDKMISEGLLDEVRYLGEHFGLDCEGFQIIEYRAFKDVVFGTKAIEEGKREAVKGDNMLLKKQLTWFRRNESAIKVMDFYEADRLASEFLEN